MRVLVVGGSGLVGRALLPRLVAEGHDVVATSRDPRRHAWPMGVRAVAWRPPAAVPPEVGVVDAIVNLAGEGVMDRRWTARRKRQLVDSRVDTTQALVEWARGAGVPSGRRSAAARGAAVSGGPPVLVNANAVGYYGIAPAGRCAEDAPSGDDFLARLCVAWQEAASGHPGRTVVLRLGHVLSAGGGYLGKMLPMLRLGLAGRLGDGRQPMPWVHIDDVAGAIAWALAAPRAHGAYNVAAPDHATQAEFTQAALAAAGKRWAPPVPALALRLRFGEAAGPILGGQDVDVGRLQAAGYRFRHARLGDALSDLLAAG